MAAATTAVLLFANQLLPASASAEPGADSEVDQPQSGQPQTELAEPAPPLLHNVTYRVRADGTSRRAVVAYKADDQNINSEQPNLLPGQTFEVNTVMADPNLAGLELSIDWPYGSNLHCEILVDEQVTVQADQFIAPRLLRPKDDPLYGVLHCGAPLDNPSAGAPAPAAVPALPGYPAEQVPQT